MRGKFMKDGSEIVAQGKTLKIYPIQNLSVTKKLLPMALPSNPSVDGPTKRLDFVFQK